MRDLTGFRKGIVRIRVQGEQTERFLNLCKARKIKISSLDRTGEQSLERFWNTGFFAAFTDSQKNRCKNTYS